jgi:hypothetical protein
MFAVVDRSVLKFNRGPQPLFQLRRPPDPGLLPYFAVIF